MTAVRRGVTRRDGRRSPSLGGTAVHRAWRPGLSRRYYRRRDILRKEKLVNSKDRSRSEAPATRTHRGAANSAAARPVGGAGG